jgi:protein-disulfide isomerase
VLTGSAHLVVPFALAGGSLIFLAVIVGLFFAVAYGYYTRRGSGISQTPYRNPDGPPESPSELAHDTTQDVRDWQRGTADQRRSRRPAAPGQLIGPIATALAEWRAASGTTPVLEPPVGSTDHVCGSAQAPTLTAYLDVSSEPCRSAYRLLSELSEANQIRLAVRQLPLADVHRLSLPAAEALEAAAAQGKFFELLDHLADAGVRDETQVLAVATRLVPDPDRLQLEVGDGRYRASVVHQIRQATASGAHNVPEIYIDGTHYSGPIRRDDLNRALRRLSPSG